MSVPKGLSDEALDRLRAFAEKAGLELDLADTEAAPVERAQVDTGHDEVAAQELGRDRLAATLCDGAPVQKELADDGPHARTRRAGK